MTEQSAGHEELPRTAYLDHTLRRARTAAEQRSHRHVTLEHLLLALLDDPDAAKLLQISGADVAVIHSTVADAVNNRMASLVAADGRAPSFSYRFDLLFACANEDAASLGRRQIDGALTLIAIAKDAESNASGILAANGFTPQAALQLIRNPPQPLAPHPPFTPQKTAASAKPQEAVTRNFKVQDLIAAKGSTPRPPASHPVAHLPTGEESMEDMIASVRNIIEAEELKERQASQPNGGSKPMLLRTPVDSSLPRPEPPIGAPKVPKVKRALHGGGSSVGGFAEPPAPAFDLETTPKAERRATHARNGPRAKAGNPPLLTKLLQNIPRNARVAVPEKVQISLSKEEAVILFGRPGRRGQSQKPATEPACRAITMRLSAPEGVFFIEGLTPETQWLVEGAASPGAEAFGTWNWSAVASASGSCCLKISMSARSVDENGVAAEIVLPDQTVRVRVRSNFLRGLGQFVRALLLMLAGSGLTVGAYYALKITGKLQHML